MDSLMLLLVVLAVAATLQFYKGRRLNLILMKHYLNEIEDVIKPVDKEYTWLGGYVGYKARYITPDFDVWVTLTLLPRQSLLYFPIALITSRHDKLYLVFSKCEGNAHLIQKGYFRIKPKVDAAVKDYVDIGGVTFELLYDNKKQADMLVELVRALPKPENVKHVAVTSNFYVFMKPEPEIMKDYVRQFCNFVRSIRRLK